MYIVGTIPQAVGRVKFVIVAIDYFTKWIEAKPLAKMTCKEMIHFVLDNIICWFGLPRIIVTDNDKQLVNDPFKSWYVRLNIQQMNNTVAHRQANGLGESAKNNLMEGIKTQLGRERAGWVDELQNVLWAHRTSVKQSNGETPFGLAYRSETVILGEICMPTEFVFHKNEESKVRNQGKLGPKWEGPYRIVRGKAVVDDDHKKPFKEAVRTPLTRRIIEFVGPEYKMPKNITLYADDGPRRPYRQVCQCGQFEGMAHAGVVSDVSINFGRACLKEPHEIMKIVRKANKSIKAFKERWTVEMGFIMGVPKVMKISSFIDSLKRLELVKHFSNKTPKTVDEIMARIDEFERSEERFDNKHNTRGRDNYHLHRGRDHRAPHPPPRGEFQSRTIPIPTLEALTKSHKEILATKTQLRLPPPHPMANPFKGVEEWMNVPITFPLVSFEDVSDDPLISEAEVEGYPRVWKGSGKVRVYSMAVGKGMDEQFFWVEIVGTG
nr:hypothetical protein [Tanacetum cinerariifolium]